MRPVRFATPCLLLLTAGLTPQLRAQTSTPHPRVHTSTQSAAQPADEPYAFGADVSFLPQAEQSGAVFKDNGVATQGDNQPVRGRAARRATCSQAQV